MMAEQAKASAIRLTVKVREGRNFFFFLVSMVATERMAEFMAASRLEISFADGALMEVLVVSFVKGAPMEVPTEGDLTGVGEAVLAREVMGALRILARFSRLICSARAARRAIASARRLAAARFASAIWAERAEGEEDLIEELIEGVDFMVRVAETGVLAVGSFAVVAAETLAAGRLTYLRFRVVDCWTLLCVAELIRVAELELFIYLPRFSFILTLSIIKKQ